MALINSTRPLKVQLSRNLTRQIKRGHVWVYPDALRSIPDAAPGTPAILLDNKGGREIGRGYLDPSGAIALRVCLTERGGNLNDHWAEMRMNQALKLRTTLFTPFQRTNAYRLFNGEGDGLPGMVCDIYGKAAMIVTDGRAAAKFWHVEGIAQWLADQTGVESVLHKTRSRQGSQVTQILGPEVSAPVRFRENDLLFTADLLSGQKTGFFLDQRRNREMIRQLAGGKRVLNAFGYTGAFSVYAGAGGASEVTTVDLASPAVEAAREHWALNQLPAKKHTAITADVFEYLSQGESNIGKFDLTILDPPSFAPSEASLPQAIKAYTRLIALGIQATTPGGIVAAASCSSHLRENKFLEIIQEAVSQQRRKATLLGVFGQPPDHPAPLAMEELRYLKFVPFRLD